MITNRYKVPKKVWVKWTADAQRLFNRLYGSLGDQGLYSHPRATRQASEHWATTRWNAAWMAAHELSARQRHDNHPVQIAMKTFAVLVRLRRSIGLKKATLV